jgi:hypothetical protein
VNSWAECHAATILTRLAVFSLAVFSLALVTGGCDSFTSARAPEATAQFGVFFGGQLQRREELPFVLDASKQRQGFRVEMNEPLRAPTLHSFWLDQIYRSNPDAVKTAFSKFALDRKAEFTRLVSGPLNTLSARQHKIIESYLTSQERKLMQTHKELIVDILANPAL